MNTITAFALTTFSFSVTHSDKYVHRRWSYFCKDRMWRSHNCSCTHCWDHSKLLSWCHIRSDLKHGDINVMRFTRTKVTKFYVYNTWICYHFISLWKNAWTSISSVGRAVKSTRNHRIFLYLPCLDLWPEFSSHCLAPIGIQILSLHILLFITA